MKFVACYLIMIAPVKMLNWFLVCCCLNSYSLISWLSSSILDKKMFMKLFDRLPMPSYSKNGFTFPEPLCKNIPWICNLWSFLLLPKSRSSITFSRSPLEIVHFLHTLVNIHTNRFVHLTDIFLIRGYTQKCVYQIENYVQTFQYKRFGRGTIRLRSFLFNYCGWICHAHMIMKINMLQACLAYSETVYLFIV